jgi:hypothetical protein
MAGTLRLALLKGTLPTPRTFPVLFRARLEGRILLMGLPQKRAQVLLLVWMIRCSGLLTGRCGFWREWHGLRRGWRR